MSDFSTDDTKAIILLCCKFGKNYSDQILSQKEYNTLALSMIRLKTRPKDLFKADNISEVSSESGINKERLKSLLGRGMAMGIAVERWQRDGVQVISRSDACYPKKYKDRLRAKAPPLLFSVGNFSLIEKGGVAIVGSRNVDKSGEEFALESAKLCSSENMQVVSGGARGVDSLAVKSALENKGTALIVVGDSLLRKSLSKDFREAIYDNRLLLISSNIPDSRFSVHSAMSNNKLIYTIADYGLVVSSEHRKGGTWAGAIEEMKRKESVPIFVRNGADAPAGNMKLIEQGALPWKQFDKKESLKFFLEESGKIWNKNNDSLNLKNGIKKSVEEFKSNYSINEESIDRNQNISKSDDPIYVSALPFILKNLETPAKVDDLAKSLNISKKQMNEWLKKAEQEKLVTKLSRPVRYQKVELSNMLF